MHLVEFIWDSDCYYGFSDSSLKYATHGFSELDSLVYISMEYFDTDLINDHNVIGLILPGELM